jgi:hypothetical protein
MNYTEAVYLGSIVGAVLFFAAGYLFHASRSVGKPDTGKQNEVGVDELVQALQQEQAARRQCEDTIQQLQAMIGQMQMHGG